MGLPQSLKIQWNRLLLSLMDRAVATKVIMDILKDAPDRPEMVRATQAFEMEVAKLTQEKDRVGNILYHSTGLVDQANEWKDFRDSLAVWLNLNCQAEMNAGKHKDKSLKDVTLGYLTEWRRLSHDKVLRDMAEGIKGVTPVPATPGDSFGQFITRRATTPVTVDETGEETR